MGLQPTWILVCTTTLITARANIEECDAVSDGVGTDVAAFLDALVIVFMMAVV